jgi:hypothetical protein
MQSEFKHHKISEAGYTVENANSTAPIHDSI